MRRGKREERSDLRGEAAANTTGRQELLEDIRSAENDWKLAIWHFDNAVGEDLVDYAIYCLEAAEKKLDMLYRKAKLEWKFAAAAQESGEAG